MTRRRHRRRPPWPWRKLVRERQRRGWSFAKAAQWFGVNFSTYWRWEADASRPTGRKLVLAMAFIAGGAECPQCGAWRTLEAWRRHYRATPRPKQGCGD